MNINQELVNKFYNPKEDGVIVVPNEIPENDLIELRSFIKEKNHCLKSSEKNIFKIIN